MGIRGRDVGGTEITNVFLYDIPFIHILKGVRSEKSQAFFQPPVRVQYLTGHF